MVTVAVGSATVTVGLITNFASDCATLYTLVEANSITSIINYNLITAGGKF